MFGLLTAAGDRLAEMFTGLTATVGLPGAVLCLAWAAVACGLLLDLGLIGLLRRLRMARHRRHTRRFVEAYNRRQRETGMGRRLPPPDGDHRPSLADLPPVGRVQ